MSFNKAESVAATSGYWRWVGDVEEMRKQRKSYRPKFRMNGTEAAIASLDPDWLLAQANRDLRSISSVSSGNKYSMGA